MQQIRLHLRETEFTHLFSFFSREKERAIGGEGRRRGERGGWVATKVHRNG